jgi:predicted membrane protein
MNTSSLLWGMIFGSFGLGFFVYGKKQGAAVPLVCGLALMIFPYFVESTFLLVTIGVVLMAIPYFIRL